MSEAKSNVYARAITQLLPRGRLWSLAALSWISKTLLGAADELARVDDRGIDLIDESDPRTASETLDEWEDMLDLPDEDILTVPVTDEARQLAVVQKLTGAAGVKPQFFEDLALKCGYVATVVEFKSSDVLRVGFRVGDRCYGTDWINAYRMDVSPPAGTALTHAELEAVIRRRIPGHTYVFFAYL